MRCFARHAVALSLCVAVTVQPAAPVHAAAGAETSSRRVTITVQSSDPETRMVSFRLEGETLIIRRATLTAGVLQKASQLEPGKRLSVDLAAGEAGASITDIHRPRRRWSNWWLVPVAIVLLLGVFWATFPETQ